MLHFITDQRLIFSLRQQLISAAEEGDLERVEQLLEMTAVRSHFDLKHALSQAAANGHLHVVNRFLEIPAIAEDDEIICYALNLATLGVKFDVFNRLLQTPAGSNIKPEQAKDLLANLTSRAYSEDREKIYNGLLAMPAVKAIDNHLFIKALKVATIHQNFLFINQLLEIPAFREKLETADKKKFLSFFHDVLNVLYIINETNSIVGAASMPHDEIKLVSNLRDIGEKHKIAESDFNNEQICVIHRARSDLVNRLLFALDDSHDLSLIHI